jgi:long-chain acyl-CoA synthetase
VLLYPLYLLADVLVFKNIRKRFGKNFKYGGGVSGGAALPRNVDMFFAAAGVNLCEGYGITETAPVVACRDMYKSVFGTVGKPLGCLEARIVDPDGNECPQGKEGEVWVRGESVMLGYYKDEAKTKEAITEDSWFKTGDLGLLSVDGELVLKGRVKDTIVLRGGENIEPVPIEMKLQESMFITTAVVVGQDERNLGALIVVDEVSLKQWLSENNIEYDDFDEVLKTEVVQNMFAHEIRNLVSIKNGFKIFELIAKFKLLSKKFEVGRELSIKMEVRRNKIPEFFEKELKEIFEN